MDQRELVARRISDACAELRQEAANVNLDFLAHVLAIAIMEAQKHFSLTNGSGER